MAEQTKAEKDAAAKAAAEAAAKTSEKVVVYVGTADVREIDAASWRNVGVEDQEKVVWNKANNWSVPAKDLQAGAVKYADEADDGFVVKDA